MIDLHTHILFGVDDGAKNIDESIDILKMAEENGYTDVVLTPHFLDIESYSKEDVYLSFEALKNKLTELKIPINIYLGNEVKLDLNWEKSIKEILDSKNKFTINSTKYILIEFPLYDKISNAKDVIYELKANGLVPIIAHPERCLCFRKDVLLLQNLRLEGALVACNMGSLIGKYGIKAKKLIKLYLKEDWVDFLVSDVHRLTGCMYTKVNEVQKKVIKLIGKEKMERLFTLGNEVLNNVDIHDPNLEMRT